MNLELKDAGTARKIALVTFDAEELTKKENQACQELAKLANIPGFRKGKVPIPVIRKKFAKELSQELNRKVSTDAYEAVLESKDLKVYSILKVDPGEIDVKAPSTVEITVDVEPEFDLPDYKDYELTVYPTEVSDEEIEKEIESLRDQRASYEEVERAIVEGDYVKCSYEGKMDEKPVTEVLPDKPIFGKQANTWEEAGQAKGLGVEAIAQGLVGMNKNETKEVEASFDKDFEVEPLAGKTVIYNLEVHEVREKKAPELDEEFLKTLKLETVEELKDKIDQDLKNRKERENQNAKRHQVTQKILDLPDFPLPQQAVEEESKIIFRSNAQRAVQQGAKEEDIEAKRDELWQQAQTQGQARIKLTITLGKIAEIEKVEVTNEDLAQAATQEAMMLRKDPTVHVKELSQDRQKLNRLRQDILYDKTLEFIASNAKESVCENEEDKQE